MSTHNLCFERKYEKYQIFFSENFLFLVVKFSVHLNRRVFVMNVFLKYFESTSVHLCSHHWHYSSCIHNIVPLCHVLRAQVPTSSQDSNVIGPPINSLSFMSSSVIVSHCSSPRLSLHYVMGLCTTSLVCSASKIEPSPPHSNIFCLVLKYYPQVHAHLPLTPSHSSNDSLYS